MFWRAVCRSGASFGPLIQASFQGLLACFILTEALFYYSVWLSEGVDPYASLSLRYQLSQALFLLSVDALKLYLLLTIVSLRIHERDNNLPPQSYWLFTKTYIWPLTVAGLQMTWRVVLWSFLFLLPGFYKAIRYSFVPFVVFFEKIDAPIESLRRSQALTASWPAFGGVLLYYIVYFVASAWVSGRLEAGASGFDYGLLRVLWFGIGLYVHVFLYYLYAERQASFEGA